MVYLAADNNLALDGVTDLGEMENAVAKAIELRTPGVPGKDIKVVVEAEFSRQYLAQAGCGEPRCVNLKNWNTFRYVVAGRPAGTQGYGPAGEVLDLGANRDMTRPEELREFVQWAKTDHPADRYLLVVWNHGGGYTGLIADETSAPGRLMSVQGLRAALADVGKIDVLDFDMCLMAGYETLARLNGLVDYAVFSEAVVPGAGNEYVSLLGGLFSLPDATPAQLAAGIADSFHASYRGNRASTTISAYALAKYPAFADRLAQFAKLLRAGGETYVPLVRDGATRAQRYEQPGLHDIGDLLSTMAPQVDKNSAIYQSMAALYEAALDPGFRIRSHARTGTGQQAANVDRSTGLHILVPSGEGTDRIAESGPGSFEAYARQNPDEEWTRFLADYLRGGRATAMVDQGEYYRFEAYLVWDPNAVKYGADIDFWLLEPDGTLYIPYLGRVTPNGQMTNDSFDDDTYFEGWASFRTVAQGPYYILANLYDDPHDYRPRYNLAYRFAGDEEFRAYLDTPGQLNTLQSWLKDENPTYDKIFSGWYSDLRAVAKWTPAPPGAGVVLADAARSAGTLAPVAASDAARAPRLTARQLATARRAVADRRAARRALRADLEGLGTLGGVRPAMPPGLARLAPR
jgi:hypothetical protein